MTSRLLPFSSQTPSYDLFPHSSGDISKLTTSSTMSRLHSLTPLLILALSSYIQTTHAITWTQYGSTGCTGRTADANQWTETGTGSFACVSQASGAVSVEFGPTLAIECPVTWFSEVGCTGESESVSQDGCFEFPGTGGSFRVDTCVH